jgi:hypothetical protein
MTRRQPSANGHRQAPPHATTDWSAVQYQPAPGTPLLRCGRCGAAWLDDDPGRQAHIAVFSHSPRTCQPAQPPQPTEGPAP